MEKHLFPLTKSQEQQMMIKRGKKKRRPGNQPTGADPLVPISSQALGKQLLITEQDLHSANLLHKSQGVWRTNRGRGQNNNTIVIMVVIKSLRNCSHSRCNWIQNGKDLRKGIETQGLSIIGEWWHERGSRSGQLHGHNTFTKSTLSRKLWVRVGTSNHPHNILEGAY